MGVILLIKGLILGFSVAAPIGPIGVLCINRTINKSYVSGFVTGLGAASADLVYGIIAGLGLTMVSDMLIEYKTPMQLTGLVFLLFLGIKTLVAKKSDKEINVHPKKGLLKDYLTTFMLIITNPVTILFFIAVFAGLGLSNSKELGANALFLVAGVFFGSLFWWLLLSGITYKLKKRIGEKILRRIDLVSGIVILGFCVYMVADLISGLNLF